MFRPNTFAWLYSAGKRNVHGKISFAARRRVALSVIHMSNVSGRTTVRADSSGSRGGAREIEVDAIFLMSPNHGVKMGDSIEKDGFRVEVVSIEPHYGAVGGRVDHYQIAGRVEKEG